MAEEISTTTDSSVAITATGMTQITGENNAVMSSSSRGIEFYFLCTVVVIGVVGTATNALILYALVASKQHKKHVLIVNQNALDLFASFFVSIGYSLKLCNLYLTGSAGYWLCTLLFSGSLSWCGLVGSAINLAIISVERYLKVVHRTWSKKNLHKWVIYSAAAFAWISSTIYSLAAVFPTTRVIDGVCYQYAFWESRMAFVAQTIWSFVSFYVIILLIFIFCYWRILMVIRHQASIMEGHSTSGGSSNAPLQSHHIQTSVIKTMDQTPLQPLSDILKISVIKTMVFISILFAITFLPNYVVVLLTALNPGSRLDGAAPYASIVMEFLYVSVNPFIYATRFDAVKEVLLRIIPCKKTSEQPTENVATA